MRRTLTLAAFGLALAGTQALADGTLLKSCAWSDAGSCPFAAVKGTDYLIRAKLLRDCGVGGRIELVNPAGQVTVTLPLDDDCDYSNFGREFRAAFTATYQLRYVPGDGVTPGPLAAGADLLTDCRADAKTRCAVPLNGRKIAGEHSANGDPDWYRIANLRRGRLYTFTVSGDMYTAVSAVNAKGETLARGHSTPETAGTVRFRPRADGTYFLRVPNGSHYTLSGR